MAVLVMELAFVRVMYLFSWASVSEAIDDRLMQLTDCYEKWTMYEKHRAEVTERVADVEKLVGSLPAAMVGDETEHRRSIDSIHVSFTVFTDFSC